MAIRRPNLPNIFKSQFLVNSNDNVYNQELVSSNEYKRNCLNTNMNNDDDLVNQETYANQLIKQSLENLNKDRTHLIQHDGSNLTVITNQTDMNMNVNVLSGNRNEMSTNVANQISTIDQIGVNRTKASSNLQSERNVDHKKAISKESKTNIQTNSHVITGRWVVYYSWELKDDNIYDPRYEMDLHYEDGKISGHCVPKSGPACWKFVVSGDLRKARLSYQMFGDEIEVYCLVTLDSENFAFYGRWYQDRMKLKEGGVLFSVKKGCNIPKYLLKKYQPKYLQSKRKTVKRFITPKVVNIDHTIKADMISYSPKKKLKYSHQMVRKRKRRNLLTSRMKDHAEEKDVPRIPSEYQYTNLTGAWNIYDNDCPKMVDVLGTLYLTHDNNDDKVLNGYIDSPSKSLVVGDLAKDGINVNLAVISVVTTNPNVSDENNGQVCFLRGMYNCDDGIVFHYFKANAFKHYKINLHNQFSLDLISNRTTQKSNEEVFPKDVEMKWQKYWNAKKEMLSKDCSEYISFVLQYLTSAYFEESENDLNYVIYKKVKLIKCDDKHIKYRIKTRQKQKKKIKEDLINHSIYDENSVFNIYNYSYGKRCSEQLNYNQDKSSTYEMLPDFIHNQSNECLNQTPYIFGDFVQVLVLQHQMNLKSLDDLSSSSLSSPISSESSFSVDNCKTSIELRFKQLLSKKNVFIPGQGNGKWHDGVVISIYKSNILVRYNLNGSLYDEWINCGITCSIQPTPMITYFNQKTKLINAVYTKSDIKLQPNIRLSPSIKLSSDIKRIIISIINNSKSIWRDELSSNDVISVKDRFGQWYKGTVCKRYGPYVYVNFDGWNSQFNEWFFIQDKSRLNPYYYSQISKPFSSNILYDNVTTVPRINMETECLKLIRFNKKRYIPRICTLFDTKLLHLDSI